MNKNVFYFCQEELDYLLELENSFSMIHKNEDEVMVTDKGRDYVYEVSNHSDEDESSSESSSDIPHKS